MTNRIFSVSLSVALVLVVGCAVGGPEPQQFVLEGDDVVVGPTHLGFPVATHPGFATARPDDLVAGIQGGGFVRRIVDIDRGDGRYGLFTEDITIGEAVEHADSVNRFTAAAGGSQDFTLGFSVRDILLHDEGGVRLELDRARLSFTPTLDLDLVVDDWRLEHFLINATGQLEGEIRLQVISAAGGTWNIVKQTWTDSHAFIQWIGWVPVVEVVELVTGVGVDIQSQGSINAYFAADFTTHLGAGVEYVDGGWRNLGSAGMSGTASVSPDAVATGAVAIKPYVFAEIRVRMYGAAGPFVKVKPALEFRRAANGSWTRSVGISAAGGAELAIPFGDDLRYEANLFDVSVPL